MARPASTIIDRASAAAIDRGHLARMTFGDRRLEREVLGLFDRQAGLLLARMRSSAPQAMATLAHTLRGSASSIGAERVANAAAAVEQAGTDERDAAIKTLATAIIEARAAIAVLLAD
jgi:HPt (histidine-containing phosphotransfer) domain-containing protein